MSALTRMRFVRGGGILREKIFHISVRREISVPALKKSKMVSFLSRIRENKCAKQYLLLPEE